MSQLTKFVVKNFTSIFPHQFTADYSFEEWVSKYPAGRQKTLRRERKVMLETIDQPELWERANVFKAFVKNENLVLMANLDGQKAKQPRLIQAWSDRFLVYLGPATAKFTTFVAERGLARDVTFTKPDGR